MFKDYLKTARPEVTKDGLVLWLQGEDFVNSPNTTVWRNRAGITANNGNATGFAYTSASGSNNQGSVRFDGSNDIVNCGNNASFNSNYITLEAKIYLVSNPATTSIIVGKTTGTTASPYTMSITSGRVPVFFSAGTSQLFGAIALDTGKWYNITFRTNGTNLVYYVNGIQETIAAGFTASMATNANPVTVGNNDSLSRQFNGIIQTVRIYNRGLTDAEIRNNVSADNE